MEHVWDVSHCRRCGASLMSVQMGSESPVCGQAMREMKWQSEGDTVYTYNRPSEPREIERGPYPPPQWVMGPGEALICLGALIGVAQALAFAFGG